MDKLVLFCVQEEGIKIQGQANESQGQIMERDKNKAQLNMCLSVNDYIHLCAERTPVWVKRHLLFAEDFLLFLLSLIATIVPDGRK